MRRVVWLMISSIMLVGDVPNQISHASEYDIPKINNGTCYYDKLLGDEFGFAGDSQAEVKHYDYLNLFLQPNANGLKLLYQNNISHHGRLTNTIIHRHYKAFRKVILDNCQPAYIAVKRNEPLQRQQIEKLGIYFINNQMRLNNIKNNLEQSINKSIYVKAPVGYIYLNDKYGITQKIRHGTKLLVDQVMIDSGLNVVYIIVKYDNNYLKYAYNSDYYSSKPSFLILKHDLWNNYQFLYFFFILIKHKLAEFISVQKNNNNEFMSFYFSVYDDMIMFSNENKDHTLM
jgi:hypothetical protein